MSIYESSSAQRKMHGNVNFDLISIFLDTPKLREYGPESHLEPSQTSTIQLLCDNS